MMRRRVPLLFERYKIDIGFYCPIKRRVLTETCNEKSICLFLYKQLYCLIWKYNTNLLKDAEKIEVKFHFFRNRIDNKNLKNLKKYSSFQNFQP